MLGHGLGIWLREANQPRICHLSVSISENEASFKRLRPLHLAAQRTMVNRPHIGPYLPTRRLTGEHGDSVICLAFSANARYLASGSDDATLVIWRVEDGIKLSSFRLDSPALSLVWDSHRENRLFIGCLDGTAGFIDKFKVLFQIICCNMHCLWTILGRNCAIIDRPALYSSVRSCS